jgi:hypothetical protein
MKYSIKLLTFFFLLLTWTVSAQTNVSGGVYNSTTWTKANSPYIVIDTVVVFPGVTLTIEAGVTLKFDDDVCLEIREGTLIAIGNSTDSITFTSNSANPVPGIWKGIVFNDPVDFQTDYCNYKYADKALNFLPWNSVNVIIQHSYFYNNIKCIPQSNNFSLRLSSFNNNSLGIGVANNCIIDSCTFVSNVTAVNVAGDGRITNSIFTNNDMGLILGSVGKYLIENCTFCNNKTGCYNSPSLPSGKNDSLINCNFSLNGIGLKAPFNCMTENIFTNNDTALWVSFIMDTAFNIFNNFIYQNQIGLVFEGGGNITNNKICNNTLYNLQYSATNNMVIADNCWCETDSIRIQSKIYDGYTNVSFGLIQFTPFISCDSSIIDSIPSIDCSTIFTNINDDIIHSKLIIGIYPNPASNIINIYLNELITDGRVRIFSLLGKLEYSSTIENQTKEINVSTLKSGVYILEATVGNEVIRQKFIKE